MIAVVSWRIFLSLTSQALSPTLYKLAHMIFPHEHVPCFHSDHLSGNGSDSGQWHCNCKLNLHTGHYQRWWHSVGSHLLLGGECDQSVYGVGPGAPRACATALRPRDGPCIYIHFQHDGHVASFCCGHELVQWACQVSNPTPNDHAGKEIHCHAE